MFSNTEDRKRMGYPAILYKVVCRLGQNRIGKVHEAPKGEMKVLQDTGHN